MSRRTLERDPVRGENVQLKVHAGGGIPGAMRRRGAPRTLVAAPPPVAPDLAPASPHSAIDEQWSAHLAEPTRRTRDRLLVLYLPLVHAVAHRIASSLPTYVEASDLAQSGVFGLVDAIDRFDPSRCPRFESYAAQRIRGAILDELRAQDWVPRTVRGRTREIERAQERLEGRLQRRATERELATELGVPLREVRAHAQPVQVLSVEALEEAGGTVEFVADGVADPMIVVEGRETSRHLRLAVAGLAERDRTVIKLYYLENLTLAEIGRYLGLTESRVCQLHARAVLRLRGRLDELAAG